MDVIREGQRRQVTVLFADMVDYTATAERLGEEATFALMKRLIARMGDVVVGHEGTVQSLTGDGFMALFGAPVAIEDAPLKACRTALDIHRAVAALDDEIAEAHDVRPRFRVGIHTGPLVVGRVGEGTGGEVTALGDTVNLASRLEAEAEPGGTPLSETTQRLVDGFVLAPFAGERALKGKAEPQRAYRLETVIEGASRFGVAKHRGLTALVGRETELETLLAQWEQARDGAKHVVDIIGDAGIGKSRLVHEFRERVADDMSFVLQGHCTPDGRNSALLPFIEVVRTSFRISPGATSETIERQLRRGLEILGLAIDAHLPYLLNLLGQPDPSGTLEPLAAEVIGVRTRDALIALLRERLRLSPVVLFIDDLHWIDSTSEELLDGLDADGRLLLIRAYRPGYVPPWHGRADVTELALAPLNSQATLALLKDRLATDDVPDAIGRLITEKAEGNPLFAEEIANYLVEQGRIVQRDGGVALAEAADNAGALPLTLHNLLMDRFDRLPETAKGALEAAAVIGTVFNASLVAEVCDDAAGAEADFATLERHELVFRGTDPGTYRFKHVLVREAIYDSLLTPARAALHERVATALERRHSNNLVAVADDLADHYGRTPCTDKALVYLRMAGEKSLKVYALEEAERRLRDIFALIERAPDCADDAFLADVVFAMCRLHYFNGDFEALMRLVAAHLPRIEALGDQQRLAMVLFETGYAHVFSARPREGKALLERALALAEAAGDEQVVGRICVGFAWYHAYWTPPGPDKQAAVAAWTGRGVELGQRHNAIWTWSKCLSARWAYAALHGRIDESREHALALVALSRTTGDPRPRSMALWALAWSHCFVFEPEEALERAEEGLRLALAPVDRQVCRTVRAAALVLLGRLDEGVPALRAELDNLQRKEFHILRVVTDVFLGVATAQAGELAAGIAETKDYIRRCADLDYLGGVIAGHLMLAEIDLEIAAGENKPSFAVLAKNLGFLVVHAPVATRTARRHAEAAVKLARENEMPLYVIWGLTLLGLVNKAKRRPAAARACLDEARPLAEAQDLSQMVARIDAALAGLP